MIVRVSNLGESKARWPLTIDRIVVSVALKIENSNYY